MKNQKGQIGIVLTLIAMGLMTVGIGIGTWAVKNPSSPFYTKAGENKPDLQITEIVIPTNIQEGDNPKFTITQKNIGNAASVHGNAKVNIYNDKGTEVQLWEQSWPKDTLNPGESTSASITWTSAPAGDHKICAEADYYNKNNELDETNNKLCEDFQVYVSGEPTPTVTPIGCQVNGDCQSQICCSHVCCPTDKVCLSGICSASDATATPTPTPTCWADGIVCFGSAGSTINQCSKCCNGSHPVGSTYQCGPAPTATPTLTITTTPGPAATGTPTITPTTGPTATLTPTTTPAGPTATPTPAVTSDNFCGFEAITLSNTQVVPGEVLTISFRRAAGSNNACFKQLRYWFEGDKGNGWETLQPRNNTICRDAYDPYNPGTCNCNNNNQSTNFTIPINWWDDVNQFKAKVFVGCEYKDGSNSQRGTAGFTVRNDTGAPKPTPTPGTCISVSLADGSPDGWDNPQYKDEYKLEVRVCNVYHQPIHHSTMYGRIVIDDENKNYFFSFGGGGIGGGLQPGECKNTTLGFNMEYSWKGTPKAKAKYCFSTDVVCGPIDIPQSCYGCVATICQPITFGGYGWQITPTPTTTPSCPFKALALVQDASGNEIDGAGFFTSGNLPNSTNFDAHGKNIFSIDNLANDKKTTNASITLSLPGDGFWGIVSSFCSKSCGTGYQCPTDPQCPGNAGPGKTDAKLIGFNVDCGAEYVYGWKLNYTGPTFTPTPPVTATPTVTPVATVTPTEVPGATNTPTPISTNTPTPTNTPAPGGNTWQVDARWDGSAQCWYADATCGNIGWSGQPSGNPSCSNCLYCSVNRDGNYIQIENRTGSTKTFQCEWHDCNGCTTQCTYRSPPCDSNTAECRENTPTSETITLPNGGIVQCKLKGGTATPAPTAPPGATNTPTPTATPTPIPGTPTPTPYHLGCKYVGGAKEYECARFAGGGPNLDGCTSLGQDCVPSGATATPTPTVTPTITLMPVPGEVILTDHKKPVWQDSGYEFKATFSKSNKFNKDNNMIIGGVRFQAIISNSKGGTPLLCRGSYYTIEDEVSSIDVEFNCYSWDDCSNSEKGYGKDSRYFLLLVYRDDAKNYQNCYFGKNFRKCIEGEFHNPVEYFSGFGANEWNKGFEFQSPSLFIPATAVDQACEANGVVNARDYSIIIVNYGKKSGKGDVNDDGVVNGKDLSLVLKYLGKRVLQTTPAQILTPKVTQPRY